MGAQLVPTTGGDVAQNLYSDLATVPRLRKRALIDALSLAAAELLYENYREDGVRNLVHNPDRVAQVTADLDKRLGL